MMRRKDENSRRDANLDFSSNQRLKGENTRRDTHHGFSSNQRLKGEDAIKLLSENTDEAEIYFSIHHSNSLGIRKGEIDVFKENVASGYGIRVIKDKKMGFLYTNSLDLDDIERVLKIARVSERDEFLSLPEMDDHNYRDSRENFDPGIKDVTPETALESVSQLLESCEDYNVNPATGGISWSYSKVQIWNSHGVYGVDRSSACMCHLSTVKGGREPATGFYYDISRSFDLDFFKIGETASRLARDSIDAKRIGTLDTTLVLKPHAVGELLENVLIPSFNADNVQRGRSVLKGRVGEKVFSENLDIVDDGTLKDGIYTSKFDGEGEKTKKTALVDRGILRGYLFDTYTANKGGVESTGNAQRDSYSALPSVGPSNFVIKGKSGDRGLETKGLVVYGLIGAHTANPITGDFSVETRNAFLNGEPVKKAILSGNVFELLNKIEGFGKDVKQVSSIMTPSIEFSDVRVVS